MYGYFKVDHTFFDAVSFPKSDIDYIVNQYSFHVDTLKIALNTHVRYKRIIREHFGFLSPNENLRKILEAEAGHLISKLSNPKALFYALVEISVSNQYEVPTYTFLVRIITEAINSHKRHIFD
ncbi:MAG: DUF4158 domain-containing protein [Sulfuricurvum sp.]|nr:DUF4158 domain-containing protein [Sulfuricurvum sp.]